MRRALACVPLLVLLALLALSAPSAAAPVSGDVVAITDETALGSWIDVIINATSLRAKGWQVSEVGLFLDVDGFATIDGAWPLIVSEEMNPTGIPPTYDYNIVIWDENWTFLRIRLPDTDEFEQWLEAGTGLEFGDKATIYVKVWGGGDLVAVSNPLNITLGRASVERVADDYITMNSLRFSFVDVPWTGSVSTLDFFMNLTELFGEPMDLTLFNVTKITFVSANQSLDLVYRELFPNGTVKELSTEFLQKLQNVLNETQLAEGAVNITGGAVANFSLIPTDVEPVAGVEVHKAVFAIEGFLENSTATYYNLSNSYPNVTPSSAWVYDWTEAPEDRRQVSVTSNEFWGMWENSYATSMIRYRSFWTEVTRVSVYPSIEVSYEMAPADNVLDLGNLTIRGYHLPANAESYFVYLYYNVTGTLVPVPYGEVNITGLAAVNEVGNITLEIRVPFAPFGDERIFAVLVVNATWAELVGTAPDPSGNNIPPRVQIGLVQADGSFDTTDTTTVPMDYVLVKGVGFHANTPIVVRIYNVTGDLLIGTVDVQVAEDGSLRTDGAGNFSAVIRVPELIIETSITINFTVVDGFGTVGYQTATRTVIDYGLAPPGTLDEWKLFVGDFRVTTGGVLPEQPLTVRYVYEATWEPEAERTLLLEIIGVNPAYSPYNVTLKGPYWNSAEGPGFSGTRYVAFVNLTVPGSGYARVSVPVPVAWYGNYTVRLYNETATKEYNSTGFANVTVVQTVAALGQYPEYFAKEGVFALLDGTIRFLGYGWGNETVNITVAGKVRFSVAATEIEDGRFEVTLVVQELIPVAGTYDVLFTQYLPPLGETLRAVVVVSVAVIPVFELSVDTASPMLGPGDTFDVYILPILDKRAMGLSGILDNVEFIEIKEFVKRSPDGAAELYSRIVLTAENVTDYVVDPETGLIHLRFAVPAEAAGWSLAVEVTGKAVLYGFAERYYATVVAVTVMPSLQATLKNITTKLDEYLVDILTGQQSVQQTLENLITGYAGMILRAISESTVALNEAIMDVREALDLLGENLTALVSGKSAAIISEIGLVRTDVDALRALLADFNKTLVELVITESGKVVAEIDAGVGTIIAELDGIEALVEGGVARIVTEIGEVSADVSDLRGVVEKSRDTVIEYIDGTKVALVNELGRIIASSAEDVKALIEALGSDVESLVRADLLPRFDELSSALAATKRDLVSEMRSVGESIARRVAETGESVTGEVKDFVEALVTDTGKSITDRIDEVKDALAALATKEDVSGVVDKLSDVGGNITMYGAASIILLVIALGLLAYGVFARKP